MMLCTWTGATGAVPRISALRQYLGLGSNPDSSPRHSALFPSREHTVQVHFEFIYRDVPKGALSSFDSVSAASSMMCIRSSGLAFSIASAFWIDDHSAKSG